MMSPISPSALALSLALYGTAAASPLLHRPRHVVNNQFSCNNLNSEITWGPCPSGFPNATNVQCTTYEVPLDWDDLNGNETISLGLIRLATTDKSKRIGNLFINPGGPGGPATQIVSAIAGGSKPGIDALLERFDLIGLDPRGVGLSTPVQCDVDLFNKRTPVFTQTREAYEDLVAHNLAVRSDCLAKTGRLLDFVDTISAVKDHEAVRLALGGEKTSFVGLSYGTQLFSQYAQLFPDGIRAMVLDGNLQHSQSESSNLLIESAAYEAVLKQFFAWSADNDDSVLKGEDAQQAWLDVLAKAAAAPIPAPGCDDGPDTGCRSDVTEEEVRLNGQGLLISVANWPTLAQALVEARDSADATLISLAQPLAVGDPYVDSYLFGGNAIQCQDWTHATGSLAAIQQKQELGATFSPLTRGASQTYTIQTRCIGWPAPKNPPKPVSYEGDATLLMVNSNYDPR